jgi:transposase InsO family protein
MNVGMPPRSRNHRLPAADDAPTASAASSLLNPFTISRQNRRSTSRRSDGAPGDLNGPRPVNPIIHPAGLPTATLLHRALRPPIESAQYGSEDFADALLAHTILASVGSTGDCFDNAMAESLVDSFKTELIADRVWRTRSQLEFAIVAWVGWYNQRRLHSALGDIPPAEFELQDAPNEPAALFRGSRSDGPAGR